MRNANILLILAMRDAAKNNGKTSLSIKRVVETWAILGLKDGDAVKHYVDDRNAKQLSTEEELPDIAWDVDIMNTDWSKYKDGKETK
ncbi:hypothetical protein ACRHK7_01240 [Weissella tructae]|uniref:hypothetical protein n=1 Tax=Weissella tructae TaxID=887702 RepID=UPI003D94394E